MPYFDTGMQTLRTRGFRGTRSGEVGRGPGHDANGN